MAILSNISRGMRIAMIAMAAITLTACASKNADQMGLGASGQQAAQPGSPQDFTINVGDRVFFETDSSQVSSEGAVTLDRQAQWLAQYPSYKIQLEGHADERGTREYNIALGARRAAAARDYLIAKGINPARMSTTSFGKERPVAVCNDISCWSQNRRAVTVLTGQ